MSDGTRNAIEVTVAILQLAVLLGTAAWAIVRFRREGTHTPRIEFGVSAAFWGPIAGYYLCELDFRIKNLGLLEHRFRHIKLRVLGIGRDDSFEEWKGHDPRVAFPLKLIDDAEVLHRPATDEGEDYIFVRPGVDQSVPCAVRIPEQVRFIHVLAEFKYANNDVHSCERVFEVKEAARV
jgi:hypothetical protein